MKVLRCFKAKKLNRFMSCIHKTTDQLPRVSEQCDMRNKPESEDCDAKEKKIVIVSDSSVKV